MVPELAPDSRDLREAVERVRRRGAGVGVAGEDVTEEEDFTDPLVAGVDDFLFEREAEREGV